MHLNNKIIFLVFLSFLLSCSTTSEKNSEEKLETYTNNRFSFSILIPKNFKKYFSENSDGITLTHPKNKNIEIRVWAGHNALFHNLEKEARFRLEEKKIISKKDITHVIPAQAGIQKIKGKQLESEEGNQKILEVFILHKDVFYSVRLEAPKDHFETYKRLFETMIQSLKL